MASGRHADAALADLDRLLGQALRHRRLRGVRGSGAEWRWDGMGTDLASPLWPVAMAAAALLTSADAERITVCDGLECGWMFVDRSRNGLRRSRTTAAVRGLRSRHELRISPDDFDVLAKLRDQPPLFDARPGECRSPDRPTLVVVPLPARFGLGTRLAGSRS